MTSPPSSSIDDAGMMPRASLIAIVWISFAAALLLVVARTATRFRYGNRRLSGEDYWMFLALAALLSLCVLETIQVTSLYYITAVLAGSIPLSQELIAYTEDYLRYEFPIIILFWTVLWCVKASFLALYLKLFRELLWYRRVWYLLATFTVLAYIGCNVTLLVSCGPNVANFFRFGRCASAKYVWASNFSVYYSTAIDVFTDLCSMCSPPLLSANPVFAPCLAVFLLANS